MSRDPIDQSILDALRCDARTTHASIGREVGLTGAAVLARVRRLEETGEIRGYRVLIRQEGIQAVVRVSTRPTDEEAFERFVASDSRVEACYDVDGEDSFVLNVRCRDTSDLRALLLAVRRVPSVMRTVTNIVLAVIKEPS